MKTTVITTTPAIVQAVEIAFTPGPYGFIPRGTTHNINVAELMRELKSTHEELAQAIKAYNTLKKAYKLLESVKAYTQEDLDRFTKAWEDREEERDHRDIRIANDLHDKIGKQHKEIIRLNDLLVSNQVASKHREELLKGIKPMPTEQPISYEDMAPMGTSKCSATAVLRANPDQQLPEGVPTPPCPEGYTWKVIIPTGDLLKPIRWNCYETSNKRWLCLQQHKTCMIGLGCPIPRENVTFIEYVRLP